MIAEALARHFPEREAAWIVSPDYLVSSKRQPFIRCACGFVIDVPDHLGPQKWAEHVVAAEGGKE